VLDVGVEALSRREWLNGEGAAATQDRRVSVTLAAQRPVIPGAEDERAQLASALSVESGP
jgi:hypothetical protein